MKKQTIVILAIVGFVGIMLMWIMSTYNSIVTLDEAVPAQWAQVENAYKRRADLIPNLVETVKGYAKHESGTLEAITNARAKATQITVDPSNLTADKLKEFQAAQGQMSAALGKLLMIKEQYPELKANENFLRLQDELSGTENRISTERNRFNEAAKEFNSKVRRFPGNLFGFDKRAYFEATVEEKATPKVKF